jgi:GAF domain-containing protein
MSASVRPSMLYKCVLAGIEHRLVCFLVVTQGSQGDLCGLLTALYAGIPKDGNSNVVADLIRGICKDLLHVEDCSVVLLTKDQHGSYLPTNPDVDIFSEFSNIVLKAHELTIVDDVSADSRLADMKARVEQQRNIAVNNIAGSPIFHEDNVSIIGLIHVWNKEVATSSQASVFDASDLKVFAQISEAAKAAFSIAARYYESDFRLRANAALLAIVRERSEDRPLQQTWEAAVKVISDFLNPQLCSIFLCDNSNNEVFNVASKSGEDLMGLTLPFGKGIVGFVAESGVALRTDNAYADPRFFRMVDVYTGQHTKTVLCVPVPGFQRSSRPIAVVQVINKLNGLPFFPEEQQVVENIANELSFSLRRKAIELNDLKHRANRSNQYELNSEVLAESILREYGAVTKQYMTEDKGVQRRVSFLGYARQLTATHNSGDYSSEKIMEMICDYNTDPFLLKESVLVEFAVHMICSYGLAEKFSINQSKLRNFIGAVRSKYRPENAFHNFQHAWGVMHLSFMLLRNGAEEYLTALDIFALLVSAICHDSDHPGNNNAFEIAMRSELALLYSDDSVLERHHLAVTNLLLSDPNISVTDGLSPAEQTEFRQLVTAAILATDMSQHFKIVDDIIRRTATPVPYSREDAASRKALIGHILHAADIGAQTQCPTVALKWTDRLVAEFSSQAQREIDANIPLTPFLHGLDDELKKMQLQAGFVTGIVMPLFAGLAGFLPELDKVATKQLRANRDYYQEQAERIVASRNADPAAVHQANNNA